MPAGYYGKSTVRDRLRLLSDLSKEGVSLLGISKCCRRNRLRDLSFPLCIIPSLQQSQPHQDCTMVMPVEPSDIRSLLRQMRSITGVFPSLFTQLLRRQNAVLKIDCIHCLFLLQPSIESLRPEKLHIYGANNSLQLAYKVAHNCLNYSNVQVLQTDSLRTLGYNYFLREKSVARLQPLESILGVSAISVTTLKRQRSIKQKYRNSLELRYLYFFSSALWRCCQST